MEGGRLVRELRLRRRRAHAPWVYLLYHRHPTGADPIRRLVLATEERRDVERREIGVTRQQTVDSPTAEDR